MTARECTVRRYVHSEGITQFTTSPDGKYVITCGGDSDVRTFEDIDDDSCAEFSVASDQVTAIVCWYTNDQKLKVAVATDDHTVLAYTYSGSSDGILVRFTAPINHMSVNKTNTLLAAGSSDFQIKIVSLEDYVTIGCFTEHVAPVLTVQFDPVGEFLASSSCDGTFKLWGIKSQNCVASLKVLVMANDVTTSKSLCRLSWKPHGGKALAVPVESEVKIYERLTWKPKYSLKDDYHLKGVNAVCWSHDASCLAVGGVDGHMSIWNYGNQQLCLKLRNEESVPITCIAFHLIKKHSIIFADKEGYIGSFESVLSTDKSTTDSGNLTNEDPLMEGITHGDLFDDVDDDMQDYNDGMSDMASLNKDDLYTDANGDHHRNRRLTAEQQRKSAVSAITGGDDVSVNLSEDHGMTNSGQLQLSDDYFESHQDAFQPSETPRHLQHRYMVYNLVGMVFSHDEDDGSALIEVEFLDIGVHHSFSIANHDGYTMASLSEAALVLASEPTDDSPSQLHCVHFNTWDSCKDWTVPLSHKESIKAIALGDGWVTVATSLNMLRLFSLGGIQLNILCLPGPVVAMAAHKQKLSIAYSSMLCTPKIATIYLWELDVVKKKQLVPPNHPLPLSHSAQLVWIGYSTDGMLVTVDSLGIVRSLCASFGISWTPLLDLSNNLTKKTDAFFVTGITCDPYEIKCIHCKGLPYPPTYPRSVMTSLPVQLPLCNRAAEKTKFEEELLMSQLSSDNDINCSAQALMKLFALSCKNSRFYRAMEVAEMLPTTQSLQLALTYASRSGNSVIADRINDIICTRESLPALSDDDEDLSCNEDQELAQHSSSISSLQQKQQQKISSNSFRLLKKLPSSYSSHYKKTTAAKSHASQQQDVDDDDDNVLSDDSCGTKNVIPSGSHDQEATPFDEENNTLQLFDDNEDTNSDAQEKTRDPVIISKCIKHSLGSQSVKANPFKVTDTKLSSVEPPKRRTSFLESITTSAVEEANTKSRKRQGSDGEATKVKRGRSSSGSIGKTADKKVQQSLKNSFTIKKGQETSKEPPLAEDNNEPPPAEDNNDHDTTNTEGSPTPADCNDSNQLSSKEKLAKFSFAQ